MDNFTYPLACQAIPRICATLGLDCELPEEMFPDPSTPPSVASVNRERERLLAILTEDHGITLRDLFLRSGIGEERSELVERFVPHGSEVLDLGSGRGYFTFAAALRGSRVLATDMMDDEQRSGWWKMFNSAASRLGVSERVAGLRADATTVPLLPGRSGLVACVHAVRNILSGDELAGVFREAARLMGPDCVLLVAESSPEAETPAEEVYLAYLRLRKTIGWEATLPSLSELEDMVSKSGLTRVRSCLLRFGGDYAPVELSQESVTSFPPSVREEHARLERLRQVHGIRATAISVVTAGK